MRKSLILQNEIKVLEAGQSMMNEEITPKPIFLVRQ